MERRLLLEKLMVTMPQLATPTISLSNDTLSIEEVENAEYYDIYVDGVLEESVPAEDTPAGGTVNFNFTDSQLGSKSYIKIYDGTDDTGTLLFESEGLVSTPSPTLTCSTGYLFVGIYGAVASIKNIVTSENITLVSDTSTPEGFDGDDWVLLEVNGNGTVSALLDWSD